MGRGKKREKEEKLSICSVRRGLFNQAGICQLSVACKKRKLSQKKWQSYILILAKMWVIMLSVREIMKYETKKMSS